MVINLDMYQTLGLATVALLIGAWMKKKIRVLERFCIPDPVAGGLFYALLMYVLYANKIIEFNYDETLKNVCMVIFFTSVGFQANVKILKKGGTSLIIFLILVIALVFSQNGLSILLSKLIGVDSKIGLSTGSIPMIGGHGTKGATTLCTAAATFGLVMGSLMGGPVGQRLIKKHDLLNKEENNDATALLEEERKHQHLATNYAAAAYQIAIAMGAGTVISWLLSLTKMTFPVYIGAMIVAAIMRNVGEYSKKLQIHIGEINSIGGICLSLFL